MSWLESLIAWLNQYSGFQLSTIVQPWTAPVLFDYSWSPFSLFQPVQSSFFTSLWADFFYFVRCPKCQGGVNNSRVTLVRPPFDGNLNCCFAGRVAPAESLFRYAAPDTYNTINDLTYLPDFSPPLLTSAQAEEAQELCDGNQQCLFDFSVTGDKAIAQASVAALKEFAVIQEDVVKGLDTLLVPTKVAPYT